MSPERIAEIKRKIYEIARMVDQETEPQRDHPGRVQYYDKDGVWECPDCGTHLGRWDAQGNLVEHFPCGQGKV